MLEAEHFVTSSPESQIGTNYDRQFIGQVAVILDNQWRLEAKRGNATLFLNELIEKTKMRSGLPDLLTLPGDTILGRRQPSFTEAAVETAKRLKFLDHLTKNIPSSVLGIVLGGSLSWGRFYNVRGQPDPSDVDIFYVVDPSFFENNDVKETFTFEKSFREDEIESLYHRAAKFPVLYQDKKAQMMSQKFQTSDFISSVKLLPFSVFEAESATKLEAILQNNQDIVEPILDYKQEPSSPIFTQYNFFHEPYTFHISEVPQPDGSVVTTIPGIILIGGHFYTGDHHNQVMPKLEVIFERNGLVTQTLVRFRNILRKRVTQERKIFPAAFLKVINTHDRKDFFSPQILEEARKNFDEAI